MQPILILINNQPVQIGCKLPESITQFGINLNLFIKFQCEQYKVAIIKAWLNDVVDRRKF